MAPRSAHSIYRKLAAIGLALLIAFELIPLDIRSGFGPTKALAEAALIDEIVEQDDQNVYSPISTNVSEPEDVLPSDSPSNQGVSPENEAAIEAEKASAITVRSGISLRSSQMILNYYSQYSDAPFLDPATTYNHKLAQMSIHMAICSNRPIPYSSEITLDPDQFLIQYLTDCGFTDLREDDYDKVPSLYTVATAMGSKRLIDDDGEPFTLIAVGVCGGNYKKEWLSNMTVGSGNRHEGFDSAARMVTDRIYGYIGTRHITGRIKVWITGFSRAGAVTNLTAANLVDAGTIAKEDIFAYTFATPRTTRKPTSEGYENIYNIVGAMDMVPQMAPAEWGFGRYGTDLILPGAETDTNFGSKYKLVKTGFEEIYGSQTNYNAKLNLALRLAMGLFLQIVDSPEEYDTIPEETILSLLEDHSPRNILCCLRSVTVSMKNDPPEKQVLENQLIDFIGRLATGFFFESGEIEKTPNSGSAGARVFHEHIEDLYMMWMSLDLTPEELFSRSDKFTYVILLGNANYTVENTTYGEPWYRITNRNDIERLEAAEERNVDLVIECFENDRLSEPLVVAVLPADTDYRVSWEGGTAEVEPGIAMVIPATVSLSTFYNSGFTEFDGSFGTEGILFEVKNGTLIDRDGAEVTLEERQPLRASDLAWLLGFDHMRGGWRLTIAQNVLLTCLVLVAIRAVVAAINRRGSKDAWRLRFAFSSLIMVAIAESEVSYWLFAGTPHFRLFWKAVAAVGVLLYCLSCKKEGSEDFLSILLALVLCLTGDLAVNFWFLQGVILLALAHLNLIRFLLQKGHLRRTTWGWWALVSLGFIVASVMLTTGLPLVARAGIAFYGPILLLTLICGLNQSGNLKMGSILFVISDCALAYYLMNPQYPYVHMAYMALSYLGLTVICRSLIDEEVFVGTPDHMKPSRFSFRLPWMRNEKHDEADEAVSNLGDTLLG